MKRCTNPFMMRKTKTSKYFFMLPRLAIIWMVLSIGRYAVIQELPSTTGGNAEWQQSWRMLCHYYHCLDNSVTPQDWNRTAIAYCACGSRKLETMQLLTSTYGGCILGNTCQIEWWVSCILSNMDRSRNQHWAKRMKNEIFSKINLYKLK